MGSSKPVLLIGFNPDLLDFSSPELAPMNLTAEKVRTGVHADRDRLNAMGYDATVCFVDLGVTADKTVADALRAKSYQGVLIGAGIRTNPRFFLVFEKLINVVHEHAPKAKICFNTKPSDSAEAVKRWL